MSPPSLASLSLALLSLVLLSTAAMGCSSDDDTTSAPLPPSSGLSCEDAPIAAGKCNAIVEEHPPEPGTHVEVCSELTFSSNPPSTGAHYGIWAAFKTYQEPVPRGFYLHSLEHGAVAILYNCPEGCDDEVAAAQALIDSLSPDPLCEGYSAKNRIVMTPDPLLDTRFAAAAWNYTLTADCFDQDAFAQFICQHYGEGPELLCNDGSDVIAEGRCKD